MPTNNNIQFRKGTFSQWNNANPILAIGEPGFEIDSNRLKIGVGLNWDDTNYISSDSLITTVYNKTGSTISGFNVVYVSGGHGNKPAITLSIANSEATSSKTYGITVSDISNNSSGLVITNGSLKNLNTNIFGTNKEGSSLWLSPTVSGGITLTKPYAPDHAVFVGTIVRSHNTQGVVEVRIQNGYELEELHNVATTGATNGQFLQYNSGSGLWMPSSSGNFTTLSINGASVATDNSSIVRTTGNQSIGGIKSFNSQPAFNYGILAGGPNRFTIGPSGFGFTIDRGDLVPETYGDALKLDVDPDNGYGYSTTLKTSGPVEDILLYLPNSPGTLITDNNLVSIVINAGSGLSGGGNIVQSRTINVGQGDGISVSADSIAVNNTVVRTTGNQNLEGNVTIGGDLTVNGSTVITNVDTVTVEDPVITLGLSSGNIVPNLTYDRGLALVRGTGLTAFMGWDTSASEFIVLSSGVAGANSGTYTPGTYGDLRANSFIKHNGTSSQFLKADGSVDSTTYVSSTDSTVVRTTGDQNIAGIKTFNSTTINLGYDDNSTIINLGKSTHNLSIYSTDGLGDIGSATELIIGSSANSDTTANDRLFSNSNGVGILKIYDTNSNYVVNRLYFSVDPSTTNTAGNTTIKTSPIAGNITLTLPSSSGTLALTSNINTTQITGVLAVNKGGTGKSSYNNGELLIGSGTSLVANTLSAGSGISITNGSGTITINTSGLQAALTNPVTGTGVANHIPYWSSTSGLLADSSQLYWDSTNNRLGIGTSTPSTALNVSGITTLDGDLKFTTATNRISWDNDTEYLGRLGDSIIIGTQGTNRILVNSTGNVGIGTDSPGSKLDVRGSAVFNEEGSDADFRIEGDTDANLFFVDASTDRVGIGTITPGYKLQVSGSFGATTKSFRIDHPSKEGYSLEYGSLESPYHGVRLTGRGKVIKGLGVVVLPDYLKDLIHNDDSLNIQITNYKHGKTLYISKIDLDNDHFIVKADRSKTLGELEFFWSLTGTRKDVENLVVEKRN